MLCYMFTGGTFRTKVVAVTHRMFIHERKSYWEPGRHSGRVQVTLPEQALRT